MQIFSFSPFGYEGSLVTVEVDLRRGIPAVDIVGLADGAVKESRERMRSAIRNSNYEFPMERVLISLSPADLKKEGAGFDLAVALAVLAESDNSSSHTGNCSSEKSICDFGDGILVMGELELSGKVRAVRGVHAAASTAIASGIRYCIVPRENAGEAREVDGMKVFAAETLTEAFESLRDEKLFTSLETKRGQGVVPDGFVMLDGVLFSKKDEQFDFSLVKEQKTLVRALQVAACGGHNVLSFGPPGCGKTMCMQRFGELLPALSVEEAYPVTRIYSLAGNLSPNSPLIRKPPFRMPHQTASLEGICGGGVNCRPGEISLAHNGVLFLDEAAEFKSSVLQMLRVPLESKCISLSRAGRTTCYPANFQLLMATNPCPCGNYGSVSKVCLCSARSVELYWKKFSGPLLDRIDIRVKVEVVENEKQISSADEGRTDVGNENAADLPCFSTDGLRKEIARGVLAQRNRQGFKNALMNPAQVLEFCRTTKEAGNMLEKASEKNEMSPRALSSCLKVSRTIADMAGSELIEALHMKEAIEMRSVEGGLNM
ncbi:YifB family Mg chelatase-like AAA ATPase [Treponema sp.]|uniref:YifB family Mg chelatase-like AAA ATPase n=1 Tax=Treponema sp. TaxID=166 RepID=UPI00298DC892|nr:YifB family Mg chelatase-like AAA ATPase [Treponema sp.]MCR5613494.1 YifB family Mg chelatase-like AAA ATPase [Treponema sp.]